MPNKQGPQDQSRADHNGETICPKCRRPKRSVELGGVTEDTVSFCFGTETKACIAWTHRNETAPGEPEPLGLFGWKQQTWASIREVSRIALPVAAVVVSVLLKRRRK